MQRGFRSSARSGIWRGACAQIMIAFELALSYVCRRAISFLDCSRRMVRILFLFLLGFLIPAEAAAQRPARLALLISNQKYASAVGPLRNPKQDVALIETSLKALGFKVTVLNDADYRTMDVALKRYAAEAPRGGRRARLFLLFRPWRGERRHTDQLPDPGGCDERGGRDGLVSIISAEPAHRSLEQAGVERDAIRGVRRLPQRAAPVEQCRKGDRGRQ